MNWAVVMAGGRGTRFWPASRNHCPKPFLRLLGKQTLLEETVSRLSPVFPPRRILIVLQADLVGEAHRLLKRIPRGNILGEPVGKNTAPCSVFAASQIARRDPAAKLVFLSADQHLHPKSLFQKTLRTAFEIVDDRPVLLGMKPDSPETGYGYLEVSRKGRRINGISYFTVRRFHEKPNLAQAKRFLKQGNFLWNGGTFVWRLDAFKTAVRKYVPEIYSAWGRLEKMSVRVAPQSIYRKLPSISLDYAVMEKMRNVHALLVPFQWSDLGGWEGLARFWPADRAGNRAGRSLISPIFIRSQRNLVKVGQRLIALLGVQDLLVVDTQDALLICPRSKIEEIREVVKELERRKAARYL